MKNKIFTIAIQKRFASFNFKNGAVSVALIISMLGTNSIQAASFLEESSTTSYSQWKDPNSNITYTNFGSVNFKFKKSVNHFAPWVKLAPPTAKAGCDGVSLNGGFAAFLDLEEIGNQLEQAISSVGMGVIVVLIQTLPSIGWAFEEVQKLIRKLQSMLQNACQMVVQGLSKDPAISELRKGLQEEVDNAWGNSAVSNALKGVDAFLDQAKDVLTCDSADNKCKENAYSMLFGETDDHKDSARGKTKTSYNGVETALAKAIANTVTTKSNTPIVDTYKEVLDNRKFNGSTINLIPEELTAIKVRIAMFGFVGINESDTILSSDAIDSNGNVLPQIEAEKIAKPNKFAKVSYVAQYVKSEVSDSDIEDFLLGRNITGTQTNSVTIPGDIKFAVETWPVGSCTKTGGCPDQFSKFIYTMIPAERTDNPITISWAGIRQASYETILNAVDSSNYPEPTTPIGVYMPNGNKYVQYIKKYAPAQDVSKYADLLAKINTKYAIEALVREAKQEALDNSSGSAGGEAREKYIKAIDERAEKILKALEDYSGDVIYLNNFNQLFEELKQKSLQDKMKRVKE